MAAENGWNEWSKRVLKELERLNVNYESLRVVHEEMKSDLGKTVAALDNLDDLRIWKEKVDEVMSPSQLKALAEEVQRLKNFKTVAITVWAVAQTLTGVGVAILLKII